jgi:hypothetical protein
MCTHALRCAGTRRFGWFDRTSPESNSYSNWGTYIEGGTSQQEPNNRPAPQDCGVGNLSQVIVGVYGWSDADCGLQLPFVCEINGASTCREEAAARQLLAVHCMCFRSSGAVMPCCSCTYVIRSASCMPWLCCAACAVPPQRRPGVSV